MAFSFVEYWKEAAAVAMAGIAALPARLVWKRSMNAVQKDELLAVIEAINKRHDEHVDQDTRRFTGIFNRLDEVAKATARIEGYMQGQRDKKA